MVVLGTFLFISVHLPGIWKGEKHWENTRLKHAGDQTEVPHLFDFSILTDQEQYREFDRGVGIAYWNLGRKIEHYCMEWIFEVRHKFDEYCWPVGVNKDSESWVGLLERTQRRKNTHIEDDRPCWAHGGWKKRGPVVRNPGSQRMSDHCFVVASIEIR